LADLLDHAYQAQAKVVLVGDDRQLAAIDAGGGFRALRLRLGASELTENRRQQQAWEREALELVRSGLVEEAVAAYQAHDRVVAAESKPAATLALLQDWWAAYQDRERDPTQDVIVLAGRRAEADRLNTACQQLLAARGRLDQEQLQVEDLKLAVGDRVVCGRNAISQLGIANGTRGTVTALDPEARTLTIRVDAKDPKEVTLPAWYLDGRGRRERNRRIDLAYATTGHRAQGLTRWRALVRLTGSEDANWLYVQLSRARQDTRLYAVVGPEPQGPAELDLPDREVGDGYAQLAQALSRAGDQRLAIDTPSTLDLRRLSTRELRAERDRLRALLDQAPRDRTRELARATAHRAEAEQVLEQLTSRDGPPRQGRGMLGLLRHGDRAAADAGVVAVGPPASRPSPRQRTGAAPAPAAPGRLAGGQRLPRSCLPAGRPGAGLVASRPRPGRRTRPTRLPARGTRTPARLHARSAGTAAGRGRGRGLPPRLPRHRPRDRAWAGASRAGPAGHLAAGPPGGPTGAGPPAHHRSHPPAAAGRGDRPRIDRPPPARPATSPAATRPVRPGAGRRLTAKEANHATASFRPTRPRPRMAIVRRRAARRVDPAA
jgi:hypothetical protein